MGEVIQMPGTNPDKELVPAWICGCGGQTWFLYLDGKCVCAKCFCYTTVVKVVKGDPDAS